MKRAYLLLLCTVVLFLFLSFDGEREEHYLPESDSPYHLIVRVDGVTHTFEFDSIKGPNPYFKFYGGYISSYDFDSNFVIHDYKDYKANSQLPLKYRPV